MYDEIDMTPPMIVSFDDYGNIVSIGPSAAEGYSSFEKPYNEVKNLITLNEDPMDYVVRYDNQTKNYALVLVNYEQLKDYNIAQLKEFDNSFYSLLLQINTNDSTAVLQCDEVIKRKLNINSFKFYFTKKDNPNYLYKTLEFKINELIEDNIFSDMQNMSIFTVRNLENLCYEIV
jgi:hypothetical protein